MTKPPTANTLPNWYADANRATESEVARLEARIGYEIGKDLDYRLCEAPMSVCGESLGASLKDFIDNWSDSDFPDEECEAIAAEMREIGVREWFMRTPAIFTMTEGEARGNFDTALDGIAVAFHEFEAKAFFAVVAPSVSSRYLPIDRAPAWVEPAEWSAHVLDGLGPRYDDGYAMRGEARRAAFVAIVGNAVVGDVPAEDVARLVDAAHEWNDAHRDEWLDAEASEIPSKRATCRAAALDEAADEAVKFLETCHAVGMGMTVKTKRRAA